MKTFFFHYLINCKTRTIFAYLIGACALLLVIGFAVAYPSSDDANQAAHKSLAWFINDNANISIGAFIMRLLGIMFTSAILVTALIEWFTNQRQLMRDGRLFADVKGHLLVLGYNESVPGIIKETLKDSVNKDDSTYAIKVVVATTQPIESVRVALQTSLSEDEFKHLIINQAQRNDLAILHKLCAHAAKIILIVGETNEDGHDTKSLGALKKIAEVCKTQSNDSIITHIPCYIQLNYQSSFYLLQSQKLDDNITTCLDVYPYNPDITWARKVLTPYCYSASKIQYRDLDFKDMSSKSDNYVHLVVLGMTAMGIAIATEAAHIAHYPNGVLRKGYTQHRTRITMIDLKAKNEMQMLQTRYRELFNNCHWVLKDEDGKIIKEHQPQMPFLDVEWEFIEADVTSQSIQNTILNWAEDDKQALTIACCFKTYPKNVATAFYLPRKLYDLTSYPNDDRLDINILIYQPDDDALQSLLCDAKRFVAIHPFGSDSDILNISDSNKLIDRAKEINWKYVSKKEGTQVDIEWRKLTTRKQWSNIYSALHDRIYKKYKDNGEDEEIMKACEHNRWLHEVLMFNYRIPKGKEIEVFAGNNETEQNRLKDEEYVQNNLIDYCDLSKETQDKDKKQF